MHTPTNTNFYFDHNALLERMDNDVEFTRIVVRDSIESLRNRFNEMKQLEGSEDAHAVKSVSHSIKGLAKIVSFMKLADICFEMEKRATRAINRENTFEVITQSDILAIKDAVDGAEKVFRKQF